MFGVAAGNTVKRAQFADAVGGQQRACAFDTRIAISGVGRVELVSATYPP